MTPVLLELGMFCKFRSQTSTIAAVFSVSIIYLACSCVDLAAYADQSSTGEDDDNLKRTAAAGPLQDKRRLILSKIAKLKARGIGVRPFEELYSQIEDQVGTGDVSKLDVNVNYLNEKLDEQDRTSVERAQTLRNAVPRGSAAHPYTKKMTAEENSRSRDIKFKCDLWDDRLNRWKREGRDVIRLQATIAYLRSLLRQPDKFEYARATLNSFDVLLSNPPPML